MPKEEDKKEKKDKKKDKKEKKERKRARAKTKAKAQKKNAKKFDWNNKFRGTLAKVEAFKVDSLNKGDLNERIEAIEDLVYLGQVGFFVCFVTFFFPVSLILYCFVVLFLFLSLISFSGFHLLCSHIREDYHLRSSSSSGSTNHQTNQNWWNCRF